jgi:hypothetical protein
MPPDARAPPSSKPIPTTSFYRPKRLGGGSASRPTKDDNGEDAGKLKQGNLSETKPQAAGEYIFNGGAATLLSSQRHTKDMTTLVVDNRPNGETNHVNNGGEWIGIDQSQKSMIEQRNELHGDVSSSRLGTNRSREKSLDELLHDDFQSELDSLRESIIEALQLSHQEKERLCLEGEILEARIASMRHKIGLVRDQLLERGVVSEGDPGDLRLSLVDEGKEDMGSSRQSLDVSGYSVDEEPLTSPTRYSNSDSKRPMQRQSLPLNESIPSLQSKGCAMSDDSETPHLSRVSFLGMLGSSKSWMDQSIPKNAGTECESSWSSALNSRSFMEGADDGMPSRWRAREQERVKNAKQKEKEENQSKGKVTRDEKIGNDVNSTSRRVKDKSKENKVRDLIIKKEKEISVLEKRALFLEQDTHSIRDEVSILRKDLEHAQGEFQQERTQLFIEIDRLELDNGKLDHICLSEGVLLDERRINIEILANELKGAREELSEIQNERDRRKSEQRKKRLNSWIRKISVGSAGDDNSHSFQRRRSSQASLSSVISSLTIESMDLVDILDQLELDT